MEDWMFIWGLVGFIAFMGWMMMRNSSTNTNTIHKIQSPVKAPSESKDASSPGETAVRFNLNFDKSNTEVPCYLFLSCSLGYDSAESKKTIEDLAWMVTDKDGGHIDSFSVKAPLTKDLDQIHKQLFAAAKSCKAVVNHNVEWNLPSLEELFEDSGMKNPFNRRRKFCTMKIGKYYCEIPRESGGLKFPKFEELVADCLFNTFSVSIPKDSDADTIMRLTAKCFFVMDKEGYVDN